MDGIFFDLDGTLWDSTIEVEKAWNEILERKGHRTVKAEELKKEFGKPIEEIMRNLFPKMEREERNQLTEELLEYQNQKMETAPCKFYPQMKEVLADLNKTYPLCIVSNCQSGYIEAFLKNAKIEDLILDHTCPGDTGLGKGKNIRILMEKHGLQNIVYVGDTRGDEKACEEAEVPMVFATYGFGEVTQEHKSIQSLSELRKVLSELEK